MKGYMKFVRTKYYISKIFDIQKISMTGKFEILKIQVKNNLYKLHNFRCFFN